MLKGYDKEEAIALILSRIHAEDYQMLPADQLHDLIGQCIDADFAYMTDTDILRPDGSDGDYYYNNNNAFACIVSALFQRNRLSQEFLTDISNLVADYMDFNRSYLERKGLKYHVDERLPIGYVSW